MIYVENLQGVVVRGDDVLDVTQQINKSPLWMTYLSFEFLKI